MALPLPDKLKALVGKTVNKDKENEYEIIDYCDSGKRGHVFRAKNKYGNYRALKFIPQNKFSPGWAQELIKVHQLESQPNTVRFHIFFLYDEFYVMVFDFIEGLTLRKIINDHKLTVSSIQLILENLLFFRRDCLQKKLLHGDLHPGNIILREPEMGNPRAYEVMITDFGIGYTGAILEPKNDIEQICHIATRMLQSIKREELTQQDKVAYDEICNGVAMKSLRERSPLERGDEKTAINNLLEELIRIRQRKHMPQAEPISHSRFGDYLVGEQLGNRWKEWKELFVSSFPGYEDIVSRNTTVLTGTRGCGKTIVFRRLSKLLTFEVGPVDDGAAGELVGIYLNMNDIADAFLFDQKKSNERLAMRVIQFFHLSLLSEIIRIAATAREKAVNEEQIVLDESNHQLFNLIISKIEPKTLYPGPGLEMQVAASLVEIAKDRERNAKKPTAYCLEMTQNDWLKRFVPKLQQIVPWIGGRPLYFFLDDYSLPRVSKVLQKILNSVLFQRSDCFFFKISTESPSTLYREDYTNKVLDAPHDFELTDLGSVTIDLSDEKRETFLDDVFYRRLAREDKFQGKTLIKVLGKFDKSWAELARGIRKELEIEDDDSQSVQRPKHQVLYYGRKVFVSMWSGDTRSMVKLAQDLLEQIPDKQPLNLPIQPDIQNKEFRRTGGEFLHFLKACARTARDGKTTLPRHIVSWGEHLVKIAEAFKEICLYDLRNLNGGRKGRQNEPKQAFRIEIVDQFSLEGVCREIYEDLVRYGVFLRDDRGKSIRGAIIPRLYLRRLLIPFCTLTFSKIDSIFMKAVDFRDLLLNPADFAQKWKKDRERFNTKQMRLFDESGHDYT
jgi:tRNA A-37 threonylcarbamoyl transferase component Bud32